MVRALIFSDFVQKKPFWLHSPQHCSIKSKQINFHSGHISDILNDLFLFYFVNPFLWCATVFLNLLKQFLSVTLLKLFYLLQNSGLWGQQHKRANSSPPGDMSFNSSKSSLGSPLIHHSDHQSPDIRPNLQLSLSNRGSNFKGIVSQDFEWLQMILMNRLCVPDVLLEVYSFLNHYFFNHYFFV